MSADAAPMSPEARRFRTVILLDVAATLAAAGFMVVAGLRWVSNPWLPALTACITAAGLVMACGLIPLRRHRLGAALAWWAAANWIVALITAAAATFAWPLMMLAALFPAVLATATATGRRLVFYVATSVGVCTLVVLLGVLQDATGISADTPAAIQHGLLVFFTPALAAIIGLIVLQHSLRLQAALTASLQAQTEIAEQAEQLRLSRARVVAATDRERRRIERDLHDGAQQRLISIGIGIATATTLCRTDPQAAVAQLEDLRRQLHLAHHEVRSLAQGVYPPVLSEHGLSEAIRSAVDRYPLPLTLDLGEIGRYPTHVEAAVYFCCVEALQNAAKHSEAPRVSVALGADDDAVWFEVRDDGVGFDPLTCGNGGMVNMQDRLGASGGELQVSSTPGKGAVVGGRIPCRQKR